MKERAADVQVFAIAAQKEEAHEVREEAHRRDDAHDPGLDRLRVHPSPVGLDHDRSAHDDERGPVRESGEDLEPSIAVGATLVRGPGADGEGGKGDRESQDVGEHVAGIGKKRERAGIDPAQDLGQHDGGGQCEGEAEAAAGGQRSPVVMRVRDHLGGDPISAAPGVHRLR